MSKPTWKYKRIINLAIYKINSFPKIVRIITYALYISRYLIRFGKKNSKDDTIEKVINDVDRFIYIANPKVATRSFLDLFESEMSSKVKTYHESFSCVYNANCARRSYYHFAVVRNPWARVYSCWKDKISTENKFCDIFIITKFKGLYPNMPFSDFVHWLCSKEGSDETADRHWLSQSEILKNASKVDAVIKIEELNKHESELLKRIGIHATSLTRKNSMTNKEDDYLALYNERLVTMIYERYKEDIERFGYKPKSKIEV